MSNVNDLSINEKLDRLLSFQSVADEAEKVTSSPAPTAQGQVGPPITFSVIFFSDVNQALDHKYQLVFDVTTFADQHGFKAVWMPERHFHPFGGIYPNPATLAAALAVKTKNIRLRSGSVVLPLHHPVEVVETWAMVDNLSGGRVDMGFASGWNPNDFLLSPGTYANRKEVWQERIPLVQKLWRGEPVMFKNGKGDEVEIQIYPKPVQPELNVWFVISKLDESFIYAGSQGYNVLTMLQGIDLAEMGKKIQLYRTARKENGFDPDAGIVTLMLHTLVHKDLKRVEAAVREPFYTYIKSAVTGHIQILDQDQRPSEAELNKIVDYSYERYFKTGALFGSVQETEAVVEKAISVGVNEIACLMDFGVDY
ncbi:MAG TPA: MupA/Atu3671 family FMN-dependent luciferase-like monooxygenase, partial [Anaerolineae bacterium]